MKTRNDKLYDLLNDLSLDIDWGCIDLDNCTDYDSLYSEVQESELFDVDIIYYATAMEYLTEHDTSLQESMSLAAEMGYEPQNINSELLASLLASQEIRNDFSSAEGEIDRVFQALEEWEEEQEEAEED